MLFKHKIVASIFALSIFASTSAQVTTTPEPNAGASSQPVVSPQATGVISQPNTTTNNNQVVSTATGNGNQVTATTIVCPQPTDLVKNGLYWGTSVNNWKSYSESFDTSIVSFVGAQWVGINVGKMVCIYKGNLDLSFPITLQNDTLAQAPTGGLWGKDLGGYRNCHSINPQDCPFLVKTQSVNMQQIYQSLDFFKGKPNPLQSNN